MMFSFTPSNRGGGGGGALPYKSGRDAPWKMHPKKNMEQTEQLEMAHSKKNQNNLWPFKSMSNNL